MRESPTGKGELKWVCIFDRSGLEKREEAEPDKLLQPLSVFTPYVVLDL